MNAAAAAAEAEATSDLTDYEVVFTKGAFGWRWDATTPDGSEVPKRPLEIALYADRRVAERAALAAIKRHASPEPPMDGETLRKRVEDRT